MILKDKIALITGITNENSIAYHIAKGFSREGAKLILTYQGSRLKETLDKLSENLNAELTMECDATNDDHLHHLFTEIDKKFGGLDIFLHGIAFANKNELAGGITNSTSEGFKLAMDVSCFTLIKMSKYCIPLMEKRGGGSIMTLTYIGSVRALPAYNAMGCAKAALESSVRYLAYEVGEKNIRVNALSPAPMRTVAARSIPGFLDMYNNFVKNTFMKRHVDGEDIAGSAIYLGSDLSKMVTGMVIYIDGGFHCSALM
ncbi:MAG TPA: enoyl-ACP reductase [Spirochaetota bacterium]|jgi:enoyl-[acyl-carrier protein] reductase I|nr:MAG: Enoyl-(acyl-carrier-protein) reductase (NADH) FabI [Spirochaetes bacterium ADurb.Bin133]HNZ26176.1 enoyl-ACP reductase [Spirochaetota bacterium]HOF01745.1 enoyl-ACP reductase [Spirochaetota bacterium]HOS33441.1 enoyl-ACP reductase [Spirochaetota bacterium]HOS56384.1 enoyl-ACP reductase [Spirochaetota bacterium]